MPASSGNNLNSILSEMNSLLGSVPEMPTANTPQNTESIPPVVANPGISFFDTTIQAQSVPSTPENIQILNTAELPKVQEIIAPQSTQIIPQEQPIMNFGIPTPLTAVAPQENTNAIFNIIPQETLVATPAIPEVTPVQPAVQDIFQAPTSTAPALPDFSFAPETISSSIQKGAQSVSELLEETKLTPISDELKQIIISLHNERKNLEGALTKDVREREGIEQRITDKQSHLTKLKTKIEIVEKAQAFIGNQAEEEKRVIL